MLDKSTDIHSLSTASHRNNNKISTNPPSSPLPSEGFSHSREHSGGTRAPLARQIPRAASSSSPASSTRSLRRLEVTAVVQPSRRSSRSTSSTTLLSGSDHRELLRAVLASCCGSTVGRVSVALRPHLRRAAARHFPVPVTSLTGIFPFSHPLGIASKRQDYDFSQITFGREQQLAILHPSRGAGRQL